MLKVRILLMAGAVCTALTGAASAGDPPTGACCLPSGECTVTIQEACERVGGTYSGDGTSCEGVECPPPTPPATGACCVRGGFCVVAPEAICNAVGGTFQGADTDCETADCATDCECDWDGDGTLTSNDFFEFLSDWLNGEADFNGDGAVNSRDLFDFISCFFRAGC